MWGGQGSVGECRGVPGGGGARAAVMQVADENEVQRVLDSAITLV